MGEGAVSDCTCAGLWRWRWPVGLAWRGPGDRRGWGSVPREGLDPGWAPQSGGRHRAAMEMSWAGRPRRSRGKGSGRDVSLSRAGRAWAPGDGLLGPVISGPLRRSFGGASAQMARVRSVGRGQRRASTRPRPGPDPTGIAPPAGVPRAARIPSWERRVAPSPSGPAVEPARSWDAPLRAIPASRRGGGKDRARHGNR